MLQQARSANMSAPLRVSITVYESTLRGLYSLRVVTSSPNTNGQKLVVRIAYRHVLPRIKKYSDGNSVNRIWCKPPRLQLPRRPQPTTILPCKNKDQISTPTWGIADSWKKKRKRKKRSRWFGCWVASCWDAWSLELPFVCRNSRRKGVPKQLERKASEILWFTWALVVIRRRWLH